jgi:arylsulfatase A-like enzyme
MLGSEGQRLKRKPWEESIRVPGIIRFPAAVKTGRRSEAFFTHVDFAPTLLSLCGIKPPAKMQGSDLSGVILAKSDKAPGSAFFQIFGPYQGDGTDDGWRGVRTSRYLYARYETKPWLLYDLEKDPYEMHNLVDDPGSQGLLKEMESRLTAWMNQTGDSWKYDWHELVEDKGRLYTGGTYYTVDEYLNASKR